MKQAGKLGTICRELGRNSIQTLGISETNWNDGGSFTTIDHNFVIYSGKSSGYSQAESRKMSNLPPAPTSFLIAFLIIQH